MKRVFPLAILAALLLAACSGITVSDAKIGPLQTETINVPAPDSDTASLTLRFGAADQFRLQPGAAGLVEGTVQYNVEQLKPTVTTAGRQVTIEQKTNDLTLSSKLRNTWDLKLSDAIPLALTVEAGAYKGAYDLGGLRLSELNVDQGAADSTYDFGRPNPEQMDHLSFKSGAANLTVSNLANANAANMSFDTAAGNYTLDFGGTLARSATVDVSAAATNLTIRVPNGTPMLVQIKGGLNDANLTNFTSIGEKRYANAAWDESKPHIVVTLENVVGAVNLVSK
jgi:hypothetical protein